MLGAKADSHLFFSSINKKKDTFNLQVTDAYLFHFN